MKSQNLKILKTLEIYKQISGVEIAHLISVTVDCVETLLFNLITIETW